MYLSPTIKVKPSSAFIQYLVWYLKMASAVQVKDESAAAFSANTDSEDDDIDIDKLQPLARKFVSSSKFPVGCHVWYNLRSSPEMGHLQAKSARVVKVSIHVENGRRVYKLKPKSSEQKISFYEDQLFYAIGCPVRVKKAEKEEAFDGVVVYLEREKGDDGRRQVTYAVQYTADNYITIEPRVAADRIKYRADDCGVGVGRKDTDSNTKRTCLHEGDTDKEEKEADVSSHHSSSAESFAHASDGNDSSTARWEPPPPSQLKRGSGSEPKDSRPTKVAKRESRSEERGEVKRDASKGKAENSVSVSVRTLTIPRWWKNQWGPENRRQLYSRLVGKDRMIKSSTNCSITVDGSNPQDEMRITIESFCKDSKSKLNSIKHANHMVEKILVEYLADQDSMKRLLYDLSLYASDSLQWRDNNGELLLLHREIHDSQGSKSKEWCYLHELRSGRGIHPDDLSSLRSKLPKGDCTIEVFVQSAKVSREFSYVFVRGTKQLDVMNAALMVKDAVNRLQGSRPARWAEPKRS